MAWWLEGVTSRHFGWVRNPSEAIFPYFWSRGKNREKIRKFFFQEKSVFIRKIGDFSPIFLFLIFPPKNLFQHYRKPIFRRKIGRKKRFFCPWLCEAVSCRVTVPRLWDSVLEFLRLFTDSPGTNLWD